MLSEDQDGERGRLSSKRKKVGLLINPMTLKAILAIAPWVAKFLRLGIELVKLFKE